MPIHPDTRVVLTPEGDVPRARKAWWWQGGGMVAVSCMSVGTVAVACVSYGRPEIWCGGWPLSGPVRTLSGPARTVACQEVRAWAHVSQ